MNVYLINTNALTMTTEEKKIEIIGKIISLQDDHIIDTVNKLLNDSQTKADGRKPGWGKGSVAHISNDFDDFIPPGFPLI